MLAPDSASSPDESLAIETFLKTTQISGQIL